MKANIRKPIALLLAICMIFGILPVAAFAAEPLVPASGWTVMNEADNLTINGPSSITIGALTGDLNTPGSNPEPSSYWLHDAPAGNFTATVKISGGMTEDFVKAGILIYKDLGNTVSVVRRAHSHLGGNVFGMYQYITTWDENAVADPNPQQDAYLKIEKSGSEFKGYYSFDGETWIDAGTKTNATIGTADSLKVGVYAVDGDNVVTPHKITFEEFTINGEAVPFADSGENVPLERIELDKTSLTLYKGDSTELTAKPVPSYAANVDIKWETSNAQVAAVKDGLVEAVGEGTAVITASSGDIKAQCQVKVEPPVDGLVTYLSDMDLSNGYLFECSVGYGSLGINSAPDNGGTITLDGVRYEKGLGAHATSNIKINVDALGATLFTAVAGINDGVGSNGNVNFIITIDGEEVFRRDDITGRSAAIPVRVEIPEGAQTMILTADSNGQDAYDHACWADAKLVIAEDALDRIGEKMVEDAIELIDAIGTDITAESIPAINAARKAYDALDPYQKEKVLNYPALEAAEDKLIEIGAAIEQRQTPLMGWSSWNCYYENIDEKKLISQIDALVARGLADAGYIYFNVDDCYQNGRDPETGKIRVKADKFPNGMKYIADYAHERGLKAGIYSDCGRNTCASINGSQGAMGQGVGLYEHWEQDMRMFFLEWGYDFLKVDWCGGQQQGLNRQTEYTRVGQWIDQIELEKGTDIVYNVCCWAFPGAWVADVADSWRVAGDIAPRFSSILTQLDNATPLKAYHGPGHVNDMDMMQVGNGMSYEEDKSHFSMWCMLSVPLVLGNDLTRMSQETLDIVTNKELIAINQDPACIMATVAKESNGIQVWEKPLGSEASNVKAVAILNRNNSQASATIRWSEVGMNGEVQVRDLWAHEDLTVGDSYSVTLPAHGVVVLKVTGDTGVSGAAIKSSASQRPASVDIAAEGKLDWVRGDESKANAYIISEAAADSVSIRTVSTARVAKIYTAGEGKVTVTAVLAGKQTVETVDAGDVYTVVYSGDLGSEDLVVSVEGGTIEAVTVADAPAEAAKPAQEVLAASNAAFAGKIDLNEGNIDYISFGGVNGDVDESKAGILTDFVTAAGADISEGNAAVQTDPYDFFEIVLPAAEKPTRANIYYALNNANVNIAVAKDGETEELSAFAIRDEQTNVLSVIYTAEEDVRVTLTVGTTLAESAALTLKAVTLAEVAANTIAYPELIQEDALTIRTEYVVVDGEADDTLKAAVYDAEGSEVGSATAKLTEAGEVELVVPLPEGYTTGSVKLTLQNAAIEYECQLPPAATVAPSEQSLIGNLLAQKLVEDGAILIDVRTAEEYEAGHIEGAKNLLYTDVLDKVEDMFPDKNATYVVYCSAGKRSTQAQITMMGLGYKNVYNVGPMDSWYIEPSIIIGGSDAGVRGDEPIGISFEANIFEEGLELYWANGENATFEDAKAVPQNGQVRLTDPVVKAWLTWNDEIVAQAQREVPLMINLPIPEVEADAYMSDLTWTRNQCGWGQNQRDRSNDGNTLTIAGNTFSKGIGAHANSVIEADIPEGMTRFFAVGGVDDEVSANYRNNKTQYIVYFDGVEAERSLELYGGYYHIFDLIIPEGAQKIRLEIRTTADGDPYDHGDWGIAGFLSGPVKYELDEETWTVHNPTGGIEVEEPNKLTMAAKQGEFGQHTNGQNALLINAPDGDFVATVKITHPVLDRNYQTVALAAFASPSRIAGTTRRYHSGFNQGNNFGKTGYNGNYDEGYVPDTDTDAPAWLKLERQGNVLIHSYSWDGETWIEVGRTTNNREVFNAEDLKIALYTGIGQDEEPIVEGIVFEEFTLNGKVIPFGVPESLKPDDPDVPDIPDIPDLPVVADSWTLTSPDGNTVMEIVLDENGNLTYGVEQNGETAIAAGSKLGIKTNNVDLSTGLAFQEKQDNEIDESFEMMSGKFLQIENEANELILTFVKSGYALKVITRAYDDGVAYRYQIIGGGNLNITDETSSVIAPNGAESYSMGYGGWGFSYEDYFRHNTVSSLNGNISIPMLYYNDDLHVLFSEADLTASGTFCGALVQTSSGSSELNVQFASGSNINVGLPFESPWRYAVIGDMEAVYENTMAIKLSDAPDEETYHFSEWVEPGVVSWTWLAEGETRGGQQNIAAVKRYIDMAATLGWKYFLWDDGWQTNPAQNSMIPEVQEVIDYAAERGIGILVWVDEDYLDTPAERESRFSIWSEMGIKGIKADFFDNESLGEIQEYNAIFKDLAKYKLVGIMHGCNKPTGEMRTFPNILSHEAIRGDEFINRQANTTQHTTTALFVRAVVGPADYTPILCLKNKNNGQMLGNNNATIGHQLALTALIESGLPCMADSDENYMGTNAKYFLDRLPAVWDETRYIDGVIGDYLTVARRNSSRWYLMSIANNNARTVTFDMSEYIADGETYTAEIFRDGNGRFDLVREVKEVTADSVITINIPAHGGVSVKLHNTEASGITEIELDQTSITLEAGESKTIGYTVTPGDASTLNLQWTSSNEAVATVNGLGTVTAVAAGTAEITLKDVGGNAEATCTVVVKKPPFELNTEYWTVHNPDGKLKLESETAVKQDGGRGEFGQYTDAKNALLIDAPEGDFVATVKISHPALTGNYQTVALAAYASPSRIAGTARRYHSNFGGNVFGKVGYNGSYDEQYTADTDTDAPAWLKLERQDNTLIHSYSWDGETWIEVAKTTNNSDIFNAADLKIALYTGIGQNDSPVIYGAVFEDFTLNGEVIPFAIANEPEECQHTLVHVEAVEPGCHYLGNIEYWYCTECEMFWQDEALTQVTNSKNVILPATGEGDVEHFEAKEPGCHYLGNIEYWYCADCEQFWQDEALTQLTNSKNVILPATGEGDVEHFDAVEPACHYNGNIEYWYCADCEQFWQDEALTQITNSKRVILPATGSENVEHVEAKEPTHTENGNIEYWYCPDCEQYWQDEALTQLTNSKNVILPAEGCLAAAFTDVNLDAWYHEPIDFVLANGMMTGDKEGTFRPDVNISRAQVAQILYNMAEDKTYEAAKTFSDVKDGQWFYDAVMWAAANGYVLGDDGADTFRPDAPITRQELVVIIWRYMGKNAPADAELTFADAAEAESWAVEAIAWASENEFVKGLGDNKFAPKANASRAQMTQILMNIFG